MAFISSAQREADLEAKIKEIEDAAAGEVADPLNQPHNGTKEDEVFKKRYSDLRSHTSKVINELRKEVDGLKNSLKATTKKEIDFPKSPEEVAAWANKYPEIYDTIVTIARQNAIDVAKDTQEKVQAMEQREFEVDKRIAKNALLDAHPDFPDIASTQDFIDWIEAQPKYIYDALYVNEVDAASAVRAVDLYKADRGITLKTEKRQETPDTRDAARRVPPGETQNMNPSGSLKWTESKVAKADWKRLTDKDIADIEEAQENPAFYDISGAAR